MFHALNSDSGQIQVFCWSVFLLMRSKTSLFLLFLIDEWQWSYCSCRAGLLHTFLLFQQDNMNRTKKKNRTECAGVTTWLLNMCLLSSAHASRQLLPVRLQQRARSLLLMARTNQLYSSTSHSTAGPDCSRSPSEGPPLFPFFVFTPLGLRCLQEALHTPAGSKHIFLIRQETQCCFFFLLFMLVILSWFPATVPLFLATLSTAYQEFSSFLPGGWFSPSSSIKKQLDCLTPPPHHDDPGQLTCRPHPSSLITSISKISDIIKPTIRHSPASDGLSCDSTLVLPR